ncbi:hypothetical protein [Planctomycetes bacterium K23_9]|uniref:HTTM domain-containing protein n=1 Tax=Stieleria marina TaxID=1930275 RepID=A0A517NVG3_9BACT|nr:hypothetical protein K239x_31120 [Planctomycetes bacterium K23_9]
MNTATTERSIVSAPTYKVATQLDPPHRVLIAYRLVACATLAALFWKWSFFQGCDAIYVSFPVTDSFFPLWLQSVWTLRVAFVTTAASITMGAVTCNDITRKRGAVLALLGATVLVIHQGSHNDMTFATAWWTSLWSVWLAFRLHRVNVLPVASRQAAQDALLRRAAFVSRLILSMILLGGAVGKWTSEYWSGAVFYDIYFAERDFWVFNWLRGSFDEAALREIAMWYSRKVVVLESVAGFGLWLLPAKYAAIAGVLIFTSIALLSNFLLFSVLLSLIGLAAVGFLVKR